MNYVKKYHNLDEIILWKIKEINKKSRILINNNLLYKERIL